MTETTRAEEMDARIDEIEFGLVDLREEIALARDDETVIRARETCERLKGKTGEALLAIRINDDFTVRNCQRMALCRHYLSTMIEGCDRQLQKLRYD